MDVYNFGVFLCEEMKWGFVVSSMFTMHNIKRCRVNYEITHSLPYQVFSISHVS